MTGEGRTASEVVDDFLESLPLIVLDDYGVVPVVAPETINTIGTLTVVVNRIAAPQNTPFDVCLARLALTTATVLLMRRGQFGCTVHVQAFHQAWNEVLDLRRAAN